MRLTPFLFTISFGRVLICRKRDRTLHFCAETQSPQRIDFLCGLCNLAKVI